MVDDTLRTAAFALLDELAHGRLDLRAPGAMQRLEPAIRECLAQGWVQPVRGEDHSTIDLTLAGQEAWRAWRATVRSALPSQPLAQPRETSDACRICGAPVQTSADGEKVCREGHSFGGPSWGEQIKRAERGRDGLAADLGAWLDQHKQMAETRYRDAIDYGEGTAVVHHWEGQIRAFAAVRAWLKQEGN